MDDTTYLNKIPESPRSLLDEAYRSLGYREGILLDAASLPKSSIETKEWLEKGDWLTLASNVGAEKLFFVNNDPVIVFCEFQSIPSDEEQLNTFRRVWCMARPKCLFMAFPGELKVYSLNQSPAKNIEDWQRIRPLDVVRRVADVAEKLLSYRREQVESGQLFADARFGDINERADKRLIQDLRLVRQSLIKAGLDQEYVRYAHALIGRSIFIRYLEDRGVLTLEYFDKVAENNPDWQRILSQKPEKPDLVLDWGRRRYDRVLQNKDFTYALFEQLAQDFNGDMFPRDTMEEETVNQTHLNLLRGFLLGDVNPLQPNLFFWAYDFKVVPIELISSIYEEFYHQSTVEDDKGTHYTLSVLVEYTLSQLLTEPRLTTSPRIVDPACGSGIFLVESFRRIVRYNIKREGRLLVSRELRQILRDQIVGIEINEEAVRVAAFSLYLAFLHYQEPPDILQHKRLPKLIFSERLPQDEYHYNILFNRNTFALMDSERLQLEEKLRSVKKFRGRSVIKRLCDSPEKLPLKPCSFDIVVGNPPWGFEEGGSIETQMAQRQIQDWCQVFGWSIGDKELSQAFIARTLCLLKQNGECGLLVSTGIFFKHHENSKGFRKRWLEECTLKTVVNFAHVRHSFFDAVAPFAFVHYKAGSSGSNQLVRYWSIKRTELIDRIQTFVLSYVDLRQISQDELMRNDSLWKIYWWGSHKDAALINTLRLNTTLKEITESRKWPTGRGFQGFRPSADNYPSDWLNRYGELPIERFHRFGQIDEFDLVEVPAQVHRRGDRDIYDGWRLLIKRGISQSNGLNGQIEARLENVSYCFRNSIHGIGLPNADEWERSLLVGILWSSLARYYFFMTASSWGTWHHEIHLDEVISLPIRFPDNPYLRRRIVEIVNRLSNWTFPKMYSSWYYMDDRIANDRPEALVLLEKELDNLVFDTYELIEPERDLIRDMCEFGLDFFYRHRASDAAKTVEEYPRKSQGVIDDLPGDRREERGIEGYLYAFLQMWNRELGSKGEFRWRIIRPRNIPMLAIVFTTQEKGDILPEVSTMDEKKEWDEILKRCDQALLQPISQNIYIDGMVRVVTHTDIYIIKRNEQRLWTRTMAREDAEAALLQAMYMQSEDTQYTYGSGR